MNVLDWILVVVLVLAAFSGWRQGLVTGVLSFAGFIGGALAGAVLAPHLVGGVDGVLGVALAVGIVFLGAGLGNVLAGMVGSWLRDSLPWEPAKAVDSAGGAAFGLVSVAVVAWLVASAALGFPMGVLSTQVRGSAVLGTIDTVMPEGTKDWIGGAWSALDSTGLPQAFAGFTLDPLIPVDEPDQALVVDPAVRQAMRSVVKVEGIAPSCGSQVDGSGFVFAPGRVMTNAHVVAGVERPGVLLPGASRRLEATVVYLDTQVDVAVLRVPGLEVAPLSFATEQAQRGDSAVVAGFPGGGRLTAAPARVRGVINARGTDIYGTGSVVREVYSVRGEVLPGNSGGPLLSPDGSVYGVVFAASVDDSTTGYALTAAQVSAAAHAGTRATAPVAAGLCAAA